MANFSDYLTSFIKIILPPALHSHKLRIPSEFAHKYGDKLSDAVKLTVPIGDVWSVGLEKAGNMIWLDDGWRNFVEDNSLGCGHLLVFNFRGRSEFDVHVFDPTATETHYRYTAIGNLKKASCKKQEKVFQDENIRDDDDDGDDDHDEDEEEEDDPSFKCTISEHAFNIRGNYGNQAQRHDQTLPDTIDASTGLRRGRKRGRQASGRTLISHPSYSRQCKITYRRNEQGRFIKAESVNMSPRTPNPPPSRSSTRFKSSRSGKTEPEDSKLYLDPEEVDADEASPGSTYKADHSEGKVTKSPLEFNGCGSWAGQEMKVFVLYGEHKRSIGFEFLRYYLGKGGVAAEEQRRVIDALEMSAPDNPSFVAILQPYNVHGTYLMHLPAKFSRDCLIHQPTSIELEDTDGQRWPVYCVKSRGKVSSLSRGWRSFVKEYGLDLGDICFFELIQDLRGSGTMLRVMPLKMQHLMKRWV